MKVSNKTRFLVIFFKYLNFFFIYIVLRMAARIAAKKSGPM